MNLDFASDINAQYSAEMRYNDIDRLIVKVHWWALAGLIVLAITNAYFQIAATYQSPFSWRVISMNEAWVTLIIGFLAALIPTLLRGKMQNHYLWRVLVSLTISVFTYLYVFLGGGSIEMHFLFFVIIALMVVYSDWRLGWVMLVAVALHHGILNYVAPQWVYFYGRNDVAVIAHALPVLVLVIFTSILSANNRKVIKDLVEIRTALVSTVEKHEREMKK